ncbi:MAG TPA: hypothetical protein PK971_06365 [Saprospiraceae bacterium]|nr:hypothetical protein [Saprospiraceae bacterium]HND87928.1 hypothetical protein [Saprospiraceae bacterium]
MRFNLLYFLVAAALAGCYFIIRHLQEQSIQTFFGTAETEGRAINLEYDVMLRQVRVQAGAQVKKGDTLAIAYRSEWERKSGENSLTAARLRTEQEGDDQVLRQERDLLNAALSARQSELQGRIQVLETELAVQQNLRAAISERPATAAADALNIKKQQIAALREEMRQAEQQTREELRRVEEKRRASSSTYAAQLRQTQGNQAFIEQERGKLILLAPADGYVQQMSGAPNELVPAFRELFRISPRHPDRVIGFLHESAEIPFHLGDTVLLSSMGRTSVFSRAVLHGVSPRLVELPFRLRKFTELRTWGREVYMLLPPDNPFFIGEKILITVPQ